MSELFFPQSMPLVAKNGSITPDWYVPLQQLALQALTFNGDASAGDTVVFVSNTQVTNGPPVSAVADATTLAWLGL